MFAFCCADRLGARHEAQGGLAVVGTPEGVGAREVARAQPDQRGHARRGHRDDALEVAQDAGDEGLALGVMPSGPSPPDSRLRPSLWIETWKCQPLPTPSGVISGAKDALSPFARAAVRIVSRASS